MAPRRRLVPLLGVLGWSWACLDPLGAISDGLGPLLGYFEPLLGVLAVSGSLIVE